MLGCLADSSSIIELQEIGPDDQGFPAAAVYRGSSERSSARTQPSGRLPIWSFRRHLWVSLGHSVSD
jgi:hypothetical protein